MAFSRDSQDREKAGADQAGEIQAAVPRYVLRPIGAREPRLESANDAFRLYLAEALLDDGLPPREMLAELGLDRTMRQLDKFDPDQPRVPAGSGRESGQWTTDGSLAPTLGSDDHLASTSADEDPKVQLAGDVIHIGVLVGISHGSSPGEIPWTTCVYESAFGNFEWSRLGVWECPGIRRMP